MTLQGILIFILLIWNLLVLTIYGLDKKRARSGSWRISEKTLLLESLLLGGLGAFLGGYVFHHKTRKWYFQTCWYLGMFVDALALYFIWQI